MPRIEDMLTPQFPPTGCKQCDHLAKATNGKVRVCLVHDESIDPAWRERVRVRFEQIVMGNPEMKAKKNETGPTTGSDIRQADGSQKS